MCVLCVESAVVAIGAASGLRLWGRLILEWVRRAF